MSRQLAPDDLAAMVPCPCGTDRKPVGWIVHNHNIEHARCPACRLRSFVGVERGRPLAPEWNRTVAATLEARARHPRETVTAPAQAGAAMLPIWPPTPGFYAMSLTRGGPRVAVRIWFGHAVIDGDEQDRGDDWRCEIDGRCDFIERDRDTGYKCRVALPVDRAWPLCAKQPIEESEYRYLVAHARWAKQHQPYHPKSSPQQAVDFNTMPTPF
jgi:hypothetical protein